MKHIFLVVMVKLRKKLKEMIDRSILFNEDLSKFDYFNDANDTLFWLKWVVIEEKDPDKKIKAEKIMQELEEKSKKYIKEISNDPI